MDPLYLNKNRYVIWETEKIVVGDILQRLNVFKLFTKASTMERFRKSVVIFLCGYEFIKILRQVRKHSGN